MRLPGVEFKNGLLQLLRLAARHETSVSILIQRWPKGAQCRWMSWNNIRLELARASQFPQGSPHRCYLLHLPLAAGGVIDEEMVRASPKRATVRRFWPSQPDLRGHVIKISQGWAFSYESRASDDETVFRLDASPMRIGECITLTEPDGERLPFRVTDIQA